MNTPYAFGDDISELVEAREMAEYLNTRLGLGLNILNTVIIHDSDYGPYEVKETGHVPGNAIACTALRIGRFALYVGYTTRMSFKGLIEIPTLVVAEVTEVPGKSTSNVFVLENKAQHAYDAVIDIFTRISQDRVKVFLYEGFARRQNDGN